jgi:putative Holliday junction resolvase
MSGTLLAFDFGERRIGVAVGETLLRQAHPLATIRSERNDDRFTAIGKLIAEWQPARLIVGHPLSPEGAPHEMTARCRRFANQLRGRFGLPVSEIDERYTSTDAASMLHDAGLNGRQAKNHLDSVAAQLILQGYFDVATDA